VVSVKEMDMKFSLFLMGTRTGTYLDIVDQVQRGERMGFDGVWLAERHFANADLLFPSPMVMASYLASCTNRIRIGLAACVLPLRHPLHVAADAATLDILSGGRFDLGLSRGSMDEAPHEAFGVPRPEARARFDEAYEILSLAWKGEPFSYDGRFFKLSQITPGPRSVQWPHPPIYMVANNPQSLDTAADQGLPVFVHGATRIEELGQTLERYRTRSTAAGFNPEAADIPVNRFIFVGEDDAHARRVMREPFLEFLETRAPDLSAYLVKQFGARGISFEFLASEVCIFGGPEHCAQRLRELSERTGTRHILGTFNYITLPHDTCVESMTRFAREVMPRLRGGPIWPTRTRRNSSPRVPREPSNYHHFSPER
jgi:alkanesulfonate monooxygenase SsuD/methylene tetrahydromethanopterin reductase-like flavin-dependent oxidoreductase (luciferase family)